MAPTTFDRLTDRWLSQARNRGLPIAEVAQALGLAVRTMGAGVAW